MSSIFLTSLFSAKYFTHSCKNMQFYFLTLYKERISLSIKHLETWRKYLNNEKRQDCNNLFCSVLLQYESVKLGFVLTCCKVIFNIWKIIIFYISQRENSRRSTPPKDKKKPAALFSALPSSVSLSCHIEHKVLESKLSDNMQSTLLQRVFQTLYWEASVQGVLKDCNILKQRITTSFLFLLFTEWCC